ncbi:MULTISPECIES: transposase [Streptomyces griseus group]|uniref:transposase n=1 Tax=Streptomyces griseus group TaxID=629295 RepID=UPI0009A0EDC2
MPAPRKYPPELIERGVQLVIEKRRNDPGRSAVVREVGDLLGIHPEVLRHWVHKADGGVGRVLREPAGDAERVRLLEEENANLRRINSILKSAAVLFAAEIEHGSSVD